MSDYFPVYWFWATVCASTRDNRYNCALPTRECNVFEIFETYTSCLWLDLTGTREIRSQKYKFAPIGAVYDMWEQWLALPFIPHECVTVDETLVPFRGRCSFKQYMPAKPAEYDMEFWCLCDAQTRCCIKMKPYLGTDNGSEQMMGLGMKLKLSLTEKLDVGRTVVTDNLFTSLELLRQLRKRDLGLIGTKREICCELSQEFTSKKCIAGYPCHTYILTERPSFAPLVCTKHFWAPWSALSIRPILFLLVFINYYFY